MDTLKEELDLALSLIPVFTMISCVMCLSLLYEVNGNMKALINQIKTCPVFYILWKSNILKSIPVNLDNFCSPQLSWDIQIPVYIRVSEFRNFGPDRGDPNTAFCVSILHGRIQIFKTVEKLGSGEIFLEIKLEAYHKHLEKVSIW